MSTKKTRLYWIYILFGIALLALGAIVAPIWADTDLFFKGWGAKLIDLLLALSLAYYVVIYLLPKVKSSLGVPQVLAIVEAVLLFIVALGCVLSQFKIINITEPCQVLGFALWLRGCVEILSSHFRKSSRYPTWKLALFLALVTFGTALYFRPFISKLQFQWAIVALLLVLALYSFVFGVRSKKAKKQ